MDELALAFAGRSKTDGGTKNVARRVSEDGEYPDPLPGDAATCIYYC